MDYEKNCPETHFCRQIPYSLHHSQLLTDIDRRDSADAYVILPGGIDSLSAFSQLLLVQESAEMQGNSRLKYTSGQGETDKGVHKGDVKLKSNKKHIKPIIFLNSNHYWDNLKEQLVEMQRQKVVSEGDFDYIGFAEKPKDVLFLAQKLTKQVK